MQLFAELRQLADLEWEFIDGSIVKAHQHATGARSEDKEAIGKSRGGNTTKIHMAVDSCGLPIDFIVTGGEVHDSKAAIELLKQLPDAEHVIADRGYDSEKIREQIREKRASLTYRASVIRRLAMAILTGVCTNIAIWLRTCLPG